MKLPLLFILLLWFFQIQAQPYYGNYYKDTPTANYTSIPCIDRCYDGSIIGTSTIDAGANSFKLFKLDENGNMLWQKRIELSIPIYIPFQVCALTDSNIAILISAQGGAADFIILRCDVNGQILSVWSYTNTFTDVLFIRPYSHGGVLAAGGLGFTIIDESGNVTLNYRFYVGINSIEEKSPGTFTCIGQRGYPHSNLLIFDIDTTGYVSNAYTYPMAADSIYMYSMYPSKLIARSPGGGVYFARALGDYPIQKFLVGYFDAGNHPVWSKIVEFPNLKCKQILSDRNNGCIVTADVGNPPYMPALFKFDAAGTLEWTKLLGDSASVNMKYFSVFDLIHDAGSGWYFSLTKHNNYIFHSDSVFSTFCNTETFQPVITNVTPGIVADTLNSFPVTTATKTALAGTSINLSIYQYDACTDQQVGVAESETQLLELYPNPATEKIFIATISSEIKSISVSNLLGEEIISTNFIDAGSKQTAIDVSSLPPGIYTVHSVGNEKIWIGKFVKE